MSAIRSLRLRADFLILLICCFCSTLPASGQQTVSPSTAFQKQITLNLHAQSYDDVCKFLSQRCGFSIAADGDPIQTKWDLEFTGTVKEALDKIADAFDYTWALGKHNVVMMHKRFTVSNDLPQMHRAEWLRTAQDMLSIWNALPFDHEENPEPNYITRLYRTFTTDQKQILKSDKPLFGSQLNAEQQHLLQQYELNGCFASGYAAWQQLIGELNGLPDSTLQYQEQIFKLPASLAPPGSGKPDHVKQLRFDLVYTSRDGSKHTLNLANKPVPLEKKP